MMPFGIPIPPELSHLIEKRQRETDRRENGVRRQLQDRRKVDLGPLGAIESAESLEEVPTEDRRKISDRRSSSSSDRRKEDRRG